MANEHTQTAKQSKGICNSLKNVFKRFGSQSAPQSCSNFDLSSLNVAPQHKAAPSGIPSGMHPLSFLPASVHRLPVDLVPPADLVSPTEQASPADRISPTDTTPPANPVPVTLVAEAAKLRAKYTHFRILVIGRADAGKTTLLKRVCNTNEDPVYDKVSYHLHLMLGPLLLSSDYPDC